MEDIASFQVDHSHLGPGLYVSRKDRINDEVLTTFDMRMTWCNKMPPLDMPAVHTIEHLGATFLRNSDWADDIIYFGPMGCRTGFYLIAAGDLQPEDVFDRVIDLCDQILEFDGPIPGARPESCGNYQEQNLDMAKYYIERYRKDLLENRRLRYPS